MKIKIIDLLKINENKLPNRIKVFNTIFEVLGKNYYATSGDYENMNLLEWVHDIDDLNEQAEIIEEPKKIEKLCEYNRDLYVLTDDPDLKIKYSDDYNNIAVRINDIIDVVNKLVEDNEY